MQSATQRMIFFTCVAFLAEYFYNRDKTFFYTIISFMTLILFQNTLIPFFEQLELIALDTRVLIWSLKEGYFNHYQMLFCYSAVHLNAFTMVRYKKPIQLKYVFLLALLLLPFGETAKISIQFAGIFTATIFVFVFRNVPSNLTYRELTIVEMYAVYSAMILAGFFFGNEVSPYFDFTFAYSVVLLVIVLALYIPIRSFVNNVSKYRYRIFFIVLPPVLVFLIEVEQSQFLEEYTTMLIFFIYLTTKAKRIYLAGIK